MSMHFLLHPMQYAIRRSLCLFLFLLVFPSFAFAMRGTPLPGGALTSTTVTGATVTTSTILYIGHLNFDCYADTVLGKRYEDGQYLPKSILWGKPDSISLLHCLPDTTGGVLHPLVSITQIVYPPWYKLSGSFAAQSMNTNDVVPDLILYLWGKTAPDSTGRDTARVLVIFAQQGLDMLPTLHMDSIATGLQSAPFFAMDLRVGHEFVQPGIRDITGVESYILEMQSVQVPHDSTPNSPPPLMQGTSPGLMRIYPNPAVLEANIEADALEPGNYTVSIQAVNGRVFQTQAVQLDPGQNFNRLLDLHDLPTGYYVVQLRRQSSFYKAYPIIIIH